MSAGPMCVNGHGPMQLADDRKWECATCSFKALGVATPEEQRARAEELRTARTDHAMSLDLDALEQLANNATKGLWTINAHMPTRDVVFIATSHVAVPALILELRQARQALKDIEALTEELDRKAARATDLSNAALAGMMPGAAEFQRGQVLVNETAARRIRAILTAHQEGSDESKSTTRN